MPPPNLAIVNEAWLKQKFRFLPEELWVTAMNNFEVELTPEGKILDFLDGVVLEPTPEEYVRQRFLRVLHFEYHYPKSVLRREVAIYYGSKPLRDKDGHPVRADIVVYRSARASREKDQGAIALIVECKAPDVASGYAQLVSYIYNTSAVGGAWTDGNDLRCYRRISDSENQLVTWPGIPRKGESWDALGRRKKDDLIRPKDIKGLLRRCHNKLHGRGVDGEEEDLTMDMVRLILAKAMDEEKPGEMPDFYCTPEEYADHSMHSQVAERIHVLFSEVVSHNPDVFSEREKISVGDRAICDVVVELQRYRLLSDLSSSDDWDLMGAAYEQYTATYLKRSRGQFFTNRLIVDLMVGFLDPSYDDIILDPAGGSGGFLTGAMRHVRKKILSGTDSRVSKQRQLDRHRTRLFMVEISKRLVKIAKTAMILNGDGHTGMTQGDSLGPFENLDTTIRATAGRERPTVILTNPPFAGVGEGKISDTKVLDGFKTGFRWAKRDGALAHTAEYASGVPPEMLFFERCLQWVAPGGQIGIVLPKSFLDTQTYYPARSILFQRFRLLAVVNCHKDTFQPHTGVRTCLVFIERPSNDAPPDEYSIFMAVSKKIGQDSEGIPIYRRENDGSVSDEIDHDLGKILTDFEAFRKGALVQSEYRFEVSRKDIRDDLCINPQFYLPHLNESIRQVESLDGKAGWQVTTVGQIATGVKIFKGPRLKSEDLIVEQRSAGVESYYTPSAVLQEKADSVKLLDLKRATPKQISTINAIRVQRGDIVVTRSGSIGRVAIITSRLHNAIVSDDLIRIRIPDDDLRFYVFSYLLSEPAQNQMLRNEYGAVQQHLEPSHIADVLVPVPDDPGDIHQIVESGRRLFEQKELLDQAVESVDKAFSEVWGGLVS